MGNRNIKPISMTVQGEILKHLFPDSTYSVVKRGSMLVWNGALQPTVLGIKYDIKIRYNMGKNPDVYVVNPKPLSLAKNENRLPHVYDSKKQHICIYYRPGGEWNASMIIAKTIIPWVSEWLLHYEIWVATGIWCGGGIQHKGLAETT